MMADIQVRLDKLEQDAIAESDAKGDWLDLTDRLRRSGWYEVARGQLVCGASDRDVINFLKRGLANNL